MLQRERVKTNDRFPCSLPVGAGRADPLYDVRAVTGAWVRAGRGRLGLPIPLGALCSGCMLSVLLLLPAPQEWQVGFDLFVSFA